MRQRIVCSTASGNAKEELLFLFCGVGESRWRPRCFLGSMSMFLCSDDLAGDSRPINPAVAPRFLICNGEGMNGCFNWTCDDIAIEDSSFFYSCS
jgi:hypothetical protein